VGAAAGVSVSFGNTTYLAGLAVTAHNNAQLATSTMDNVSIAVPEPSATYVSVDTTTLGSWKGVYGAGGYSIAGDTQSLPTYVSSLTFANQSAWTWAASSTETRATQKGGTGRLASCWYSGTNFDITVNITGTTERQVAIYCLDWDGSGGRTQTIQPFDASTGTSLATAQTVSAFQNGKYLIYNVKGNVRFRVTNTASPNAAVSAVLFGN
jgi:hypothetical protein